MRARQGLIKETLSVLGSKGDVLANQVTCCEKENKIELEGEAEVACIRKKARQVSEQMPSGILLETTP